MNENPSRMNADSERPTASPRYVRRSGPMSLVAVAGVLCATLAACTTNSNGRQRMDAHSGPQLAPGVDAARARLPLAQIEPVPTTPTRPESLKPVSARAAKQVSAAHELIGEQRYTEAAIKLERALRYDPNHPDIHRTLAELHWEAGNLERAKTHATRAIEGNPDDAAAHYLLGRWHAAADDDASALWEYRIARLCSDVDRNPLTGALIRFHLAQALVAGGYLEASLKQFDAFELVASAIAEGGGALPAERATATNAKATTLEKLGRFGEAADALGLLARAADADTDTRLRHARLLLRAGRLEEARVAAAALPLDDDHAVDLLFEIHRASGHPERIVDDLSTRIAASPENPQLVLRMATALSRIDRLPDAQRELERFLDRRPDAAEVRLALIDVFIEQADWNSALAAAATGIEQSASRSPDFESKIAPLSQDTSALDTVLASASPGTSAASLFLRGSLARRAGRTERAEQLLADALSRSPDFTPARVALARVYLDSYRYDEAKKTAERRDVDVPEDLELELVLGALYDRLDDVRQAELHYNAAVQLNRADTRALFALGKLYQGANQRLRAQRQLQVLLEKDPNHEAGRELLIFTYLADGKLDVALQQTEELNRRATSPLVKARSAAFLAQVRKPDRDAYRNELREAMEQHGEDATTWLAIAESYEGDDNIHAQHRAFLRALSLDPTQEDAALGVVETSRRLLDFEGAIAGLETLLKRRPNRDAWRLGYVDRRFGRGSSWPGLIEMYWNVRDFDAAIAVARAAEAKPDLERSFRNRYRQTIIESLRLARRNDDMVARLKESHEGDPEDSTWTLLLADAYLRDEKAAQAVPLLESIYEATPRWPMLANLVQALVAADQHVRASQLVLTWLRTDPDSDDVLSRLALVEADAGRLDDAVELIRTRLSQTLDRERFQIILAGVLSQGERHAEAAALVDKLLDAVQGLARRAGKQGAIPLDQDQTDEELIHLPNEPFTADRLERRVLQLRRLQVSLEFAAKDYRSARKRLTEWLDAARDPRQRYDYLSRLAVVHRFLGNDKEAGDFLDRALLLRPDDLTLNNDVAYGWIDRGERLDEAERMIRRSLASAPRQSAYLDTYGWLLYKKGEFAEAVKWTERARGARTDQDPVILDHLGDANWRLGHKKTAVALWTACLKAAEAQPDGTFISADEKRARRDVPGKIEAVENGSEPVVAPLGKPREGDTPAITEKP